MAEPVTQSMPDISSSPVFVRPRTTSSHVLLRFGLGSHDITLYDRALTITSAVALAIIFDILFLTTRTADYSVDAVRIAQGIVTFHHTHDLNSLFRPGYLLFGALGLAVWRLTESCGYHGGIIPVLQAINSAFGAVGIGLLSVLLRQILTRSRSLTVLVPAALGLSFGYWMLATDGRAEMVATTILIGASCLLVRAMLIPTWQRAAAVGIAVGFAIVFHVFSVLYLPAAVTAILMAEYTQGDPISESRAKMTNLAAFAGAAALPVLVFYIWIGFVVLGMHSFHGWSNWIHQGFESDWWIGPHTLSDLRTDVYSLRKALFVEPGGKTGTFHISSSGDTINLTLYALSLIIWFISVYLIGSNTAFMMRTHYRAYMTVALTTMVVYAAFFTYVCPGNFVYWTPVIVASAVVISICASYYRGRRGGSFWLIGIGVWTAIFGLSNYLCFIKPHKDIANNPSMIQANRLKNHTSPGDLIVVSGFDEDTPIVVYAPFFVHRQVFSLRTSLEAHNGDVILTSRDLRGAIQAAIQSGHHAYAFGDIWSDPDTRVRLSNVSREYNPQQVFAGLQRAQGWVEPEDTQEIVWKLIPTQVPSTQ